MRAILRTRTSIVSLAVAALLAGLVAVPNLREAYASQSYPGFGYLGHASVLGSSVSGITDTETEITPLTTAFNVLDPGGYSRWVEFTAVLRTSTTTGGTTANAYIDVDDNYCSTCSTVRVAGSNTYMPGTGGAGSETMVITGFAYLRHGNFTARVFVKRSFGSGTISVSQTAGTPMTLMVSDLGK